jgi:hypothetical protein
MHGTFATIANATGRSISHACAVAAGGALTAVAEIQMRELMLFTGVALLGYGASLIFVPAGFIVSGAIFAGVSIFGTR